MSLDFNELSNIQLDVLKEVANIGAGNAATALAKMLNKKVEMKIPKVKILEFQDVGDTLGGAEIVVVGILLRVSGDMNGCILFILRLDAACILVDILLGRDTTLSDQIAFDEMDISVLKEIGNIMTGSYLSSLSTLSGLSIMPSVPDIAIDMAGAILSVPAIEFGKIGDTVLYIETEFSEGNAKVVGDFFLVPDVDSYDILLKALGVEV